MYICISKTVTESWQNKGDEFYPPPYSAKILLFCPPSAVWRVATHIVYRLATSITGDGRRIIVEYMTLSLEHLSLERPFR